MDVGQIGESASREDSFPFGNIEALKTSGYPNITRPGELGGGANLLDFFDARPRHCDRRCAQARRQPAGALAMPVAGALRTHALRLCRTQRGL